MKKILILLFPFIFICDLFSQNVDYPIIPPSKEKREQMIKERIKRDSLELILEKAIATDKVVRGGYYLQKSAKFQYGAFGCTAVSAAFFWASSRCDDKINSKGEAIKNENRKVWITAGASFAACALFCEIMSITYKLKAGKSLMIRPSQEGGVTACLRF